LRFRVPANSSRPLVVAIDGPSGSGKSSVARGVAQRLGLRFVDTGAMYRALTWWAVSRGVDLADFERVAALARELPLQLGTDPEHLHVLVDGQDVGEAIRTPEITAAVSAVATNLGVREELVRRQRALAEEGGAVIEGRDITTVVAPDADVRVLLTASQSARLARRALEVHGTDDADAVEATRDLVVGRDAVDSTVATFTEAAEGVTVVDSSNMTLDQTIEAVLALVPASSRRAGARS
jgi:cytidylate kinase